MIELFGPADIIKLALKIESNSAAFYDCLKELEQFYNIKQTFTYLAGEERRHIENFKGLFNSLKKVKPKEGFQDELETYIEALAKELISADDEATSQLIRKIKTEKEALDFAIGFEKDSILFYQEIKECIPAESHRIIDEIINEERQHLGHLRELKDKAR